MPRICLVTDRHATRGRNLVDVVAAAVRGGVDLVQLREKDLDGGELYRLGCELREVCHAGGAELLVNDRIDVAIACGADGVHLPVSSFSPEDARVLLGPGKRIGCSAHSLAEAQRAEAGGADFVVLGPIFDTASKRAYGPPLGLEGFAAIVRQVGIPVFGIGGITAERVAAVLDHGASGVAAIGALIGAADPESAARQFVAAARAGER